MSIILDMTTLQFYSVYKLIDSSVSNSDRTVLNGRIFIAVIRKEGIVA